MKATSVLRFLLSWRAIDPFFLNLVQDASFTMLFYRSVLVSDMENKEIMWDEELLDVLSDATHRKKNDLKYLIAGLAEELEIELPSRTAS